MRLVYLRSLSHFLTLPMLLTRYIVLITQEANCSFTFPILFSIIRALLLYLFTNTQNKYEQFKISQKQMHKPQSKPHIPQQLITIPSKKAQPLLKINRNQKDYSKKCRCSSLPAQEKQKQKLPTLLTKNNGIVYMKDNIQNTDVGSNKCYVIKSKYQEIRGSRVGGVEEMNVQAGVDECGKYTEIQSKKSSLYSFKMKMLFCNRNNKTQTSSQQLSRSQQRLKSIHTIPTQGQPGSIPLNSQSQISKPSNMQTQKNTIMTGVKSSSNNSTIQNIIFEPIKSKKKFEEQTKHKKEHLNCLSKLQEYLCGYAVWMKFGRIKRQYYPYFQLWMDFFRSEVRVVGEGKKVGSVYQYRLMNCQTVPLHFQQNLQPIQMNISNQISPMQKNKKKRRSSLPSTIIKPTISLFPQPDSQPEPKIDQQYKNQKQKLWYIGLNIYRVLHRRSINTKLSMVWLQNIRTMNIFIIQIDLQNQPMQVFEKVKFQEIYRFQWFITQYICRIFQVVLQSCETKLYLVVSHLVGSQLHFLEVRQKGRQQIRGFGGNLGINLDYENELLMTKNKTSIIKQATRKYMDEYFPQIQQSQAQKQSSQQQNVHFASTNTQSKIPTTEYRLANSPKRTKMKRNLLIKSSNGQQDRKYKYYDRYRILRNLMLIAQFMQNQRKDNVMQYFSPEEQKQIKEEQKQCHQVFLVKIGIEPMPKEYAYCKKIKEELEQLEEQLSQPKLKKILATFSSCQFSKQRCLVRRLKMPEMAKTSKMFNMQQNVSYKKFSPNISSFGGISGGSFNKNSRNARFGKLHSHGWGFVDYPLDRSKKQQIRFNYLYNNVVSVNFIYKGTFKNVDDYFWQYQNTQLNEKQQARRTRRSCTRKQMLIISLYTFSLRKKQPTNNPPSFHKYIVIKSQKNSQTRNTINIAIALSYSAVKHQTQPSSMKKSIAYNFCVFQRLLHYRLNASQICTVAEVKKYVLDFVRAQGGAMLEDRGKGKCRQLRGLMCDSRISLSLIDRNSIIVNQSILRPLRHTTNIFHYSFIAKSSIISQIKNSKILTKSPIYYKIQVHIYPGSNFVFLDVQCSKTNINLEIKSFCHQIQHSYQCVVQLHHKFFSVSAYSHQFSEVFQEAYHEVFHDHHNKLDRNNGANLQKQHTEHKNMLQSLKKRWRNKSKQGNIHSQITLLKRKIKLKLNRLLSIQTHLKQHETEKNKISTNVYLKISDLSTWDNRRESHKFHRIEKSTKSPQQKNQAYLFSIMKMAATSLTPFTLIKMIPCLTTWFHFEQHKSLNIVISQPYFSQSHKQRQDSRDVQMKYTILSMNDNKAQDVYSNPLIFTKHLQTRTPPTTIHKQPQKQKLLQMTQNRTKQFESMLKKQRKLRYLCILPISSSTLTLTRSSLCRYIIRYDINYILHKYKSTCQQAESRDKLCSIRQMESNVNNVRVFRFCYRNRCEERQLALEGIQNYMSTFYIKIKNMQAQRYQCGQNRELSNKNSCYWRMKKRLINVLKSNTQMLS